NAKDAMPNGGALRLSTQNVEIDENNSDGTSDIKSGKYNRAADTGIGMLKDVQDRIFEPFYTTKGKARGTGLGLATVYGIVRNHGGDIKVESELGNGSVFTLYFPVTDKEVQEKEEKKQIIKGNATILLVDDEEDVRNLGSDILGKLGYTVILANDGVEALELYNEKRNEIDLILLDIIMPRLAGKETFAELMKLNSDVKIVLISGYSQDGKAMEILNDGAIGFIQKPFSMTDVSEMLSSILVEENTPA
ncbi:response regulator, partial [candidate division KSB1 bacterium]